VTTAQEIYFSLNEAEIYDKVGADFPIELNTYGYVDSDDFSIYEDTMNQNISWIKPHGVKLILDGSIQAYTGLLTKPYWVPKEQQYDNLDNYTYNTSRSCETEWCGENNLPD
jgi:hypothetical protein